MRAGPFSIRFDEIYEIDFVTCFAFAVQFFRIYARVDFFAVYSLEFAFVFV
jgi:hypothetical protein